MDGCLSREGITADLEAMKRAGIGGMIMMEVNVGLPQGPVKFMSAEWRRLFKHLVSEAERLELELALISGPGWTGSGGPWVKPEQSMQHVVASAIEISGPRRFEGILPRPARRPAFFGDGHLPTEIEKAKDDFYIDVAVLAFPTPKAGSSIADSDEKALYVRAPYSSQPGVKPFLPSPADYPETPPDRAINPELIIDLTDRLSSGGRLSWDVPEGDWTILRLGRTSTGANTRPAPIPGLGLECDKLDPAALDAHFDAFIGALLAEIGPGRISAGKGWTTLHIDSWEMGAQNWTAAFRDEFRRRRGYDLLRYLPVITGRVVKSLEISERFLWDLRQTVQELIIENHAQRLKALGAQHGFGLSIEPYDMTPCADMSLGTVADVPMGEFWLYGFSTFHSVIEAASLAHTCGRRIVGAEAFTSLDSERWQAYPESMKALGDWAFCAGVNRIVFHRYQHQPWLDLRPGMTMGPFGVHWERTQTWWDMVPAYHNYLSRCQFMLRRGLPVADVCYLVAEGAPHVFRPPESATRGDPPDRLGYNFDGCAPETLLERLSVQDGRLVLPDGMSYRVLVLPEKETMTPSLLNKIRDLIAAGATVIGPPPRKSPSLAGYPECDAEVNRLADEIWSPCDGEQVTEHEFGKGRVIWKRSLSSTSNSLREGEENSARIEAGAADSTWNVVTPPLSKPEQYGDFSLVVSVLEEMGVVPDFQSDPVLRYTHRKDGETEIYFVVNPENRGLTADCLFRVSGKSPELWDPITGEIRDLPDFTIRNGLTSVPIRFEPHQSFFIVFRRPSEALKSAGRNFSEIHEAAKLEGPWEVSFDPKWGGPEKISFDRLEDWSQRPEEGIKFYSGIATYRKTFDLPPGLERKTQTGNTTPRLWLDLGVVKNICRVRLNGRDLGVVWCAPWRVEITAAAKPKENQLEISVANLWANRLIGDEKLPADAELNEKGRLVRWPEWLLKGDSRPATGRYAFSTWRHFNPDSALFPSGLLGPIALKVQRPGR